MSLTKAEVEKNKKEWEAYVFKGKPLTFPESAQQSIALAQSWLEKDKKLEECRKWLMRWLKNREDFIASKIKSEEFVSENRDLYDLACQLLEKRATND